VAARGLDIPDVGYVYNFELPNVPDQYVHRIGRTARAGAEGRAVALVSPEEIIEFKDIEKTMKETIPVASGREWEIMPGQKKRPNGGGGGGGRGRGTPRAGAKPKQGNKPGHTNTKPAGGQRRRRQGGAAAS